MKDRMRLFESVVTPTVLYSAGTWTINAARSQKLRVAQRRMLRSIVQVGRKRKRCEGSDPEESSSEEFTEDGPFSSTGAESDVSSGEKSSEETWVQWITRATKVAELEAAKVKVTDWLIGQRLRKWGLAGHTARRDDGRWSNFVLDWQPIGQRKVGHPTQRWTDALSWFAASHRFDWQHKAHDRKERASWTKCFAGF